MIFGLFKLRAFQPRKCGEPEGKLTLLDQFISSEMNKIHPTCKLIDDFLSGVGINQQLVDSD
jgi:hypothetical protein